VGYQKGGSVMENYLILNINGKGFSIQVNRRGDNGRCYNVGFNNGDGYLVVNSFYLPTFNSQHGMSIYGDKDTNTLQYCLKVLPKIKEKSMDVLTFLANIVKTEKLSHYQININGNMDCSRSLPIDHGTIAKVAVELTKAGINLEF